MKVKEAMHKGVEWVGPDTPVIELAKLMRKHFGGKADMTSATQTDYDLERTFDPFQSTDVRCYDRHSCRGGKK